MDGNTKANHDPGELG